MTDNELKELVAGLAIALAKTVVQMARTEAQFERTEAQFERAEAQFERTEAQMARTDAQIAKNETKLANMGIHIGGIANSQGQSTEEYFFNSLFDNPRLGNIKFDEISRNLHNKLHNLEDEFDITMFNGNNIGLIECKYRAKEEDVVKLIEKKVSNFRQLFPYYAKHTIYLGIASFSFDERLEKFAKENGVAILKQKGDVVEIEADNLKAY
jgi:hypothetical protein